MTSAPVLECGADAAFFSACFKTKKRKRRPRRTPNPLLLSVLSVLSVVSFYLLFFVAGLIWRQVSVRPQTGDGGGIDVVVAGGGVGEQRVDADVARACRALLRVGVA